MAYTHTVGARCHLYVRMPQAHASVVERADEALRERDWAPVDLDPGDICCESGISTGGVGTTTAFLDFPSEAKCQAAVAALAGADQINPSRGNHPNISPSATYRILCPLRRALKAKRYPAPAAWSLQRSGRASACLSAGRLSDGSSPADADICGIREA